MAAAVLARWRSRNQVPRPRGNREPIIRIRVGAKNHVCCKQNTLTLCRQASSQFHLLMQVKFTHKSEHRDAVCQLNTYGCREYFRWGSAERLL